MTAVAIVSAMVNAGDTNEGEELLIIPRIRDRLQSKIRL